MFPGWLYGECFVSQPFCILVGGRFVYRYFVGILGDVVSVGSV